MKTYNIDKNAVQQMARQGKTVAEIASAFDMSKSTFLRRKNSDVELSSAYETGYAEFVSSRGGVAVRKEGASWITDDAGFAFPVSAEEQREAVLQILKDNPRGMRFHSIRKATQLSADELSSIMAKLVLDTRQVATRRDHLDNVWYSLRPNQGASNERFNWSRSERLTAAAGIA
jgi:hypothetical protein